MAVGCGTCARRRRCPKRGRVRVCDRYEYDREMFPHRENPIEKSARRERARKVERRLADELVRRFSGNMCRLIAERDMSIRKLSAASGVPYTSLRDVVNGFSTVRASQARSLASALGVPLGELFEGCERMMEIIGLKEEYDGHER